MLTLILDADDSFRDGLGQGEVGGAVWVRVVYSGFDFALW